MLREASVDVGAITANVAHLRRIAGVEVMAVVKAEGYGHGAVRSASAALDGGATRLGVADVGEALALRRAGIDAPILAWIHAPGTSFGEALKARVELGISTYEQLQQAAAAATPERPAIVQLKLETGLGRNGIAPEDYAVIFSEAARLERIGRIRVVGAFSHLSNTSPEEDRASLRRFDEALHAVAAAGLTPHLRHIAATAATLTLPEARYDCVRLGIGIYGLSPFAGRSSAELGLRPAMTLRAPVAAVRRVPAGHGVSYGYDYRTQADTTLALVPLGYGDGVPRQASGGGAVRIAGATFPVAGRIAMDQFVVDVGDHPVAVGDEPCSSATRRSAHRPSRRGRRRRARSTTRSSRGSVPVCRAGRCRGEHTPALLGRHDIATPDDMERLGERLGRALVAGDLVVLTGALGAGKTTLTRGLARALGVRGPVQSPTFVIARTHPSLGDGPASCTSTPIGWEPPPNWTTSISTSITPSRSWSGGGASSRGFARRGGRSRSGARREVRRHPPMSSTRPGLASSSSRSIRPLFRRMTAATSSVTRRAHTGGAA